ncbi:hypothetical protein [Clostridium perfringens]|uniref:hypothetical protein n=1 Tax=Clostridium perfringens TaxID=1502 RepID=UPI003F420A73
MELDINTWVKMLTAIIELGRKNGFEIYNQSYGDDFHVFNEICKSDKHYNTVFLSYNKRND